jgi:uncharacterized protein YnzC (UPF0291/DUF896 family)
MVDPAPSPHKRAPLTPHQTPPVQGNIDYVNHQAITDLLKNGDLTASEKKELQIIEKELSRINKEFERGFKEIFGIPQGQDLTPENLKKLLEILPPEKIALLKRMTKGNAPLVELLDKFEKATSSQEKEVLAKDLSEKLGKEFESTSFREQSARNLSEDPLLSPNQRQLFKEISSAYTKANNSFQDFYRSYLQRILAELPSNGFGPLNSSAALPTIANHPLFQTAVDALAKLLKEPDSTITAILMLAIKEYHAREAHRLKGEVKVMESKINDIKDKLFLSHTKQKPELNAKIANIEDEIKKTKEMIKEHQRAASFEPLAA